MTPDAQINDDVPERFRGLDRFEARKQRGARSSRRSDCWTRSNPTGTPSATAIAATRWWSRGSPTSGSCGWHRSPRRRCAAYRDGRLTLHPGTSGRRLRQLARGHPRLVHLAAALVGPPHPGVVLRRTRAAASTTRRAAEDPTELSRHAAAPCARTRTCSTPGSPPGWCRSRRLGWPDDTAGPRARSIPAHTLVTAPEILFFWVARMIMAGLEFMGEVPFRTVYLHGTVRDTQHRKMSKSLGNGIDPLEVIERYGADALRYTVVSGMAVGHRPDPRSGRPRGVVRAGPATSPTSCGTSAASCSGTVDGPTRRAGSPTSIRRR